MIIEERYKKRKFSIALGSALLIQAITSLVSGIIFLGPFTDKNDIINIMINTATNQATANFSIFLDIITALVIAWLGVLLYSFLRKTNQVWATTALVFYIVEACMLIVSKFFGYALIQVSVAYSSSNNAIYEVIGQILLEVKDFSYSMHIIPFGVGAIIFYYLLYKTKVIPSWLSLWGLITVIPVLFATILGAFGVEVSFFIMLPYVPFEFITGLYIIIKGFSNKTLSQEPNTH